MKFEECSQILSPQKLAFESGLERLDNGMVHVAVLTRMPRVTAEMVVWWFGDYMQTSEHYRRWHPTDHVWMDWQDKQPGTHLGAKHLVHEYIGGKLFKLRIHFLPPEDFFGDGVVSDPERLLICAKISFLNYPLTITRMIHAIQNVEGGSEMRSHFWLGYLESPYWSPPFTQVANHQIIKLIFLRESLGRAIQVHCHEEMTNLAGFLPELYASEGC